VSNKSIYRRATRRAATTCGARLARVRRRLDPRAGIVALTFDDGPDPRTTPEFLDLLGELGVRATFFVIGVRAEAHPELIARMVDEGHAVGSHSGSHIDAWHAAKGDLRQDYHRGRVAIESIVGGSAPLFRPPRGHVTMASAVAIRREGLRPWLWSVNGGDYGEGAELAKIVRRTTSVAAGDVILLHDALHSPRPAASTDRASTLSAVREIVTSVRGRGLELGCLT
jgi:peptidoglycan/xylan/chitin deacetylase (PgdA/CDA1 family)